MTNGLGKSDSLEVPVKSPNNAGQTAAEGMEGRGLAKRNLPQQNASRIQSPSDALSSARVVGVEPTATLPTGSEALQQCAAFSHSAARLVWPRMLVGINACLVGLERGPVNETWMMFGKKHGPLRHGQKTGSLTEPSLVIDVAFTMRLPVRVRASIHRIGENFRLALRRACRGVFAHPRKIRCSAHNWLGKARSNGRGTSISTLSSLRVLVVRNLRRDLENETIVHPFRRELGTTKEGVRSGVGRC